MRGPSINSFISYGPIVRILFGQSVPVRSIPGIVPCPLCGIKDCKANNATWTMRVMDHPDGGLYWYCYNCKRGFDTIELLAATDKFKDLRAVFDMLCSNPEIFIPKEYTTADALSSYTYWYSMPNANFRAWAAESNADWIRDRDSHAMLSQHTGINIKIAESASDVNAKESQWLHFTTRKAIQTKLNNNIAPGLRQDAFSTCIALPWCKRPGKIDSLFLMGWKNQFQTWRPETSSSSSTGIMFIDALKPEPKKVLAVSSPFLALWLHHKNFFETRDAAPVVVWNDNTDCSVWEQLGIQEIVFWSYKVTPGLLKQALNARCKTSIATIEKPVFDIAYVDGSIEHPATFQKFKAIIDVQMPSKQRIAQFSYGAKDPYAVALDFLFKASNEELNGIMSTLNLQPESLARILDRAADTNIKQLMHDRLNKVNDAVTCHMFGSTVIQRVSNEECYWSFKKGTNEERISDVVVHIDSGAIDEDVDTTVYSGTAIYKGKRYPFSATSYQLKHSAVDTIIKVIEKAGGGTPFVSRFYESRLWDIIFRFSSVSKTYPGISKVGWSKDQLEFVMPNCSIRNGEILATKTSLISNKKMPCVNVSRNPEFDINDWLDFSEANGTVWAVLIALIDNILAPIRGCTKKGIGVLGPLAERVAARIYSDFELICKKTSDILDDVNKFEVEQFSHDLPVYVTENTVNSSAWVLAGVSKNVIMPIQPAQIGVATNSGEWILINTKSDTGALQRQTSVVDIVLNFLAWYQKQTKINLTATDSVSSVIGAVHTWITDTVGRDCTKLFDYVNSIITDYSVMSPGKRFVVMLYQMLKAGYLASKRSNNLDTITTTHTIILTEDDSRVYVSKRKLLTTCKRLNAPEIDTLAITSNLANEGILEGETGESNSVWVISGKFWNRTVTQLEK